MQHIEIHTRDSSRFGIHAGDNLAANFMLLLIWMTDKQRVKGLKPLEIIMKLVKRRKFKTNHRYIK